MSDYGVFSGKQPPDPDYKTLYFTLLSATQRAGRILEEAQKTCQARLGEDRAASLEETDRT